MATVDDQEERRPVLESACNFTANYKHVPRDTGRRQTHSLCSKCFPDDEIPAEIDWLLVGRWGNSLHKSTEDGEAEFQGTATTGTSLADKLADPDVTSVADLQGGGDE